MKLLIAISLIIACASAQDDTCKNCLQTFSAVLSSSTATNTDKCTAGTTFQACIGAPGVSCGVVSAAASVSSVWNIACDKLGCNGCPTFNACDQCTKAVETAVVVAETAVNLLGSLASSSAIRDAIKSSICGGFTEITGCADVAANMDGFACSAAADTCRIVKVFCGDDAQCTSTATRPNLVELTERFLNYKNLIRTSLRQTVTQIKSISEERREILTDRIRVFYKVALEAGADAAAARASAVAKLAEMLGVPTADVSVSVSASAGAKRQSEEEWVSEVRQGGTSSGAASVALSGAAILAGAALLM